MCNEFRAFLGCGRTDSIRVPAFLTGGCSGTIGGTTTTRPACGCSGTVGGTTTTRPVISDLVLACQAPVSIIFADTRDVGGVTYGHMIVELPEDKRQQEKIKSWLDANQIHFKEEEPA